jgi:DNA-binding IclR family transcriptional regulator
MPATNHSVDRALEVLRLVARERRSVRFTEILTATGIPKATLHALLGSLDAAAFLSRSADGYQIGFAAFEVGTAMPVPASLRDAVAPVLDRLVAATGESCHLGILVDGDVVYLDRRDSDHGLRFASRIGQRLPAYSTALGKAMLALLDDADVVARYPARMTRLTPATIASRSQLIGSLPEYRNLGYALESGESTPGVCCIGMAVEVPNGPLGVSITVPAQRATVEELPRYVPALTDALTRIRQLAEVSDWFHAGSGDFVAPARAMTS